MMGHNKSLHGITWILLIIGGLNWLLAVFGFDIAHWGLGMTVDKIIYLLVGLAALYELFTHKQRCKLCSGDMMNK